MISDFLRYYPAYTLDRAADEVSLEQIEMLLEQAYRRPYSYVVMVEPKG